MTQRELEAKLLGQVKEAIEEGERMLAKRKGKFKTWTTVTAKVDDIIIEALRLGVGDWVEVQASILVNTFEDEHGMTGLM